VKDTAIALFGTGDKVALLVALGLLVAILAVAIGLLEYRRPGWGVAALALVGVIAGGAAATRAGATIAWAIPTAIGVVAGAFVLRIATDRLRVWSDAPTAAPATTDVSRRGFLRVMGITAASAVVATVAAQAMRAATSAANVVRDAIALPAPAVAAPAMPEGAELSIRGLAPVITPNDSFYRIDTALQVPIIDAEKWTLKITGLVEREIEIGYRELLELPLIETVATLSCVSNEIGGNLIGNAVWLGYPIRELLAKAGPLARADMVLSTSHDGFTASTPLDVLVDENREAILAVAMNGEPLPLAHGFPVRMVVPGLYGYVSATKWVTELKVTTFEDDLAYWTARGWSDRGPVKTASRIDVPRNGASIEAGMVAVAGMAWAPHTGITGVEVRVDGGAWAPAKLADGISDDTWRQWVYQWVAKSGNHTLEVRATDASNFTQSGVPVSVVPDGAEGWHTITVNVA
jgi:DMSO/TMAO reductase YedYZ molybdopterin-dependent catalytic subunit